MQRWGVEAGEPHIANEYDTQGVFRIAEAVCKHFAPWLTADMGLPLRRIAGRTCHDDLDRAALVVILVPARTEPHEFRYSSVQMRRLMHTIMALPSIASSLEVVRDILRDQSNPLLGADD